MGARIPAGTRFIQRLADGVCRDRLVQPILSARPALVLIAAPSGYGKTVLAAQVACSGAFPEVIWIDGAGSHGSVSDALQYVLRSIGTDVPNPCTTSASVDACCATLAAWPDEQRLLVVIDDASWGLLAEEVAILMAAFAEAPRGSVVILTTRDSSPTACGAWTIGAGQLQMSDLDLSTMWQVTSTLDMTSNDLSSLVRMSGRLPALAALSLRHWAMAGGAHVVDLERDAAHLISSLVDGQLSPDVAEVLVYAALLGSGSAASLAECSGRHDAIELLLRAATVLPLVRVSQSGYSAAFSVHEMVADALGGATQFALGHSDGFERTVRILARSGEHHRAISLALEAGTAALTAWCLRESGEALLETGHRLTVAKALGRLPAVDAAGDARLLLLAAECQWDGWDTTDATRTARVALSVAEASTDYGAVVRARLLLARIRSIAMDYQGVAAEVEPLVSRAAPELNENARADAVVALLLAYTFLGNRPGIDNLNGLIEELGRSSTLRSSSRARVVVCRGIALGILDGDWQAALDCFTVARSRNGAAGVHSVVVEGDVLGAMLSVGLVEHVALEASLAMSSLPEASEMAPALRLFRASASAILGADAGLRDAVEGAVARDLAAGDTLSMTSSLLLASELAMAMRDHDYALSLAERAASAAGSAGSPVFLALAQVAQATALVAVGDIDRGFEVADRIGRFIEDTSLAGHQMRLRLVLAAVAHSNADLSLAVEHLYAVSEYIIDKSPALAVASYLRAFPGMLGPLALAMGVDRVPVRVLRLLPGIYGEEALAQAAAVLSPAECKRLAARMRNEAKKVAERVAAADLSDAVCEVRVLGRFEVIAPHGPVADRDWCKRKARLLFAMLVARAGTDVPRGEIIEYLWPEMDEDRALNNFYVVWSAMKRALAPNSIRETPCPFVEHVHGVCRIVPGRVITDLDEFEAHLAAAHKARERDDVAAELAALRAAEKVYRGDVLPGDIYDDWFAPVRNRFRHEFEDAMLRAAHLLEHSGEPHEGLSMLRRPMGHDSLREDFYQATLRLQIASGQRSAAIDTYMSCRSRLVEDLGIDPSRETTALYEQVLGMEG